MKALTVKQPWASLIAHGLKDTENRTWKTNFRGRILIHAAATPVKEGWSALNKAQMANVVIANGVTDDGRLKQNLREAVNDSVKRKFYGGKEDLPMGAILGSVEIVDCVKNHPSVWAEQGVWNWVLANPVLFDEPITGVKGKLSLWEYDGELPKPKPKVKKPQAEVSIKELQERAFRKEVIESTQKMVERLSVKEQLKVALVPLVITECAWHYAEKAMELAARYKVDILKKLCRTLKEVKKAQEYEYRKDLDYSHMQDIKRQSERCIEELSYDLQILYFTVNQEFKRKAPEYPYGDLRTYALISTLFVDLLKEWNAEVDKLLAEKLNDANLHESIIPPIVVQLRKGMVAIAGVEGKFNYKEQNIVTGMKVVMNRIKSIEFEIMNRYEE